MSAWRESWADAWRRLGGYLAGQHAQKELGKLTGDPKALQGAVTTQVGLPSLYSADAERAAARAKLEALCQELVMASDLVMRDITGDGAPETFCNWAFQRAAARYGCLSFAGMNANAIVSMLAAGAIGWRKVDGLRAAAHALRGGLGVAAKRYVPNGHLAIIAPRAAALSGSWGRLVPYVANAGRPPNRIKLASEAFLAAQGEPDYYIFGETA